MRAGLAAGARDALGLLFDAAGDAVDLDDEHRAGARRRDAPAEMPLDRRRATRVDELHRRRHDAGGEQAATPPRPRRRCSANVACSVACTAGLGTSRRVISVMMASVPSDPTSSCVRS